VAWRTDGKSGCIVRENRQNPVCPRPSSRHWTQRHGYIPLVSEYDQRAVHGGQFLVKLRTAYSERVIDEVRRRLHGTAQRQVEGSLVKVRVRFYSALHEG